METVSIGLGDSLRRGTLILEYYIWLVVETWGGGGVASAYTVMTNLCDVL